MKSTDDRALFHHVTRGVRLAAIFALLFTFESTSPTARATGFDPVADVAGPLDVVPFDRLQQTTIHNAFTADLPLDPLLALDGVRSVEIDLHAGKRFHRAMDRDWFVYHVDLPLLDLSSCDRLTACLDQVASHHARVASHAPITVFLDVKDPLVGGHDAATLDALIGERFDRSTVFTPRDLLAACPSATTLHDAVRAECGWPTIGALRGKMLFVLTGGDLCHASSPITGYVDYAKHAPSRLAFVAAGVTDSCAPGAGDGGDDVVFFNIDFDHRDAVRSVLDSRAVARVYWGGLDGGLDAPEAWNAVRELGAQFLATDRLRW